MPDPGPGQVPELDERSLAVALCPRCRPVIGEDGKAVIIYCTLHNPAKPEKGDNADD